MVGPYTDGFSSLDESPIVRIAMGDIAKVKAAIMETYGFAPTDEYCRDLIKFVEVLCQGKTTSTPA